MARGKDRRPLKRLFAAGERVSSYTHGLSEDARMKRFGRDYAPVLHRVEATLVRAHDEDRRVDDRVASHALGVVITGTRAEDALVQTLADQIATVRGQFSDVSLLDFREALRIVDESIHRRSSRQPGESTYLDFVRDYVKV